MINSSGSKDMGIIAETELSQLFYSPGSSNYTVFTFGHNGLIANGRDWWAEPLLKKLDITSFGFVAKMPHWYPTSDFGGLRHLSTIVDTLDNNRRVGYGYSMGAYAALKFSNALKFNVVIAYAPLFSISSDDLEGHTTPWSSDYKEELNKNMRLDPEDIGNAHVYIFFDPLHPEERYHAARIQAIVPSNQFHEVHVHHIGHGVIGAMASTESFKFVLNSVIDTRVSTVRNLTRYARMNKKSNIDYLFFLAESCLRNNHEYFFEIVVNKAVESNPNHKSTLLLQGRLAGFKKDQTLVDNFMGSINSIYPNDTQILVWWADSSMCCGNLSFAIDLYKKAFTTQPLANWIADKIKDLEDKYLNY